MKVHELIGSMPREQRGPSLTETKAVPAGDAGRAILAEALSKPYSPSAEPQARKMRLKEFLLLSAKLDGACTQRDVQAAAPRNAKAA